MDKSKQFLHKVFAMKTASESAATIKMNSQSGQSITDQQLQYFIRGKAEYKNLIQNTRKQLLTDKVLK